MSEELTLVKSSPNFTAICNKRVSQDCTVSHSMSRQIPLLMPKAVTLWNNFLLMSSQKAVLTELPGYQTSASRIQGPAKLSSLRLWGQIHSAKSSQHSKKNKQHLTGLFAVGDSRVSFEYFTCSFMSTTTQSGSKPSLCQELPNKLSHVFLP